MDKILIIQDSPSVNAMLKFRLESGGFSVETAETGEEGIEKTKAFQYQLILLDYNLPGMNGSQVCRILKNKITPKTFPSYSCLPKTRKNYSKSQRKQVPMVISGYPLREKSSSIR